MFISAFTIIVLREENYSQVIFKIFKGLIIKSTTLRPTHSACLIASYIAYRISYMTKSNHYFQVIYHSYLDVKTIHLLPLILRYIHRLPMCLVKPNGTTKLVNLYMPLVGYLYALTVNIKLLLGVKLYGACKLILIAFTKPLAL